MSMTSPSRGWFLETIEYNLGALQGLHSALTNLIDAGDDNQVILRNVESGLEGRGQAITRVKADAGASASEIEPTLEAARRIARTVRAYGEAVDTHARAANDLVDDIVRAHLRMERAAEALSDARHSRDAAESDTDGQDLIDARHAVTDAKEDHASEKRALDDLWEQWEAAYGFWDDAYGAAVGRLAVVLTGSAPEGLRSVVDDLANADSPAEVAAIWDSLSVEEQQRLRDGLPGFIGNLEGVPYGDRMLANRTEFVRVVAAGPHGEPLDSELADLLEELTAGGALLAFRPFESPQATAAVVYGVAVEVDASGRVVDPLSGVTNINVLVGGMFSGLGDLTAWGQSARDLNDASQRYGAEKSVTIAWYGYDSPDLVTEFGMDKAEEGAATLSSMLRGLKNAAPSGATTTVVGHSYGSTTAFLAVGTAEEDLGVDRFVAVGSAGVPTGLYLAQREHGPERLFTDPLPQLEFDGVDIYASRAPGDVVGWFGQLSSAGHTESPESYPGATTFDSDGGWVPSLEDTKKKEWAVATPGHASHDGANSFPWEGGQKDNGYLTLDSESFRNLANIVATGEPIS